MFRSPYSTLQRTFHVLGGLRSSTFVAIYSVFRSISEVAQLGNNQK